MDVRIVYSDHPNRLQRPLSQRTQAALTDALTEQAIWAATAESAFTDFNGTYSSLAMQMARPFKGGLGKTIVAITKGVDRGMIAALVELKMTDRQGRLIVWGSELLDLADRGGVQDELLNKVAPAPDPDSLLGLLKARAQATAPTLQFLRGFEPPSGLCAKLLQPEKYEPLGLTIGELAVKYAAECDCNLVAGLPDSSFSLTQSGYRSWLPSDSMATVLRRFGLAASRSNGWITLEPGPVQGRTGHIDRAVAGAFVRACYPSGIPKVEELSTYCARTSGPVSGSLGMQLLDVLCPGYQSDKYDTHLLRIYGLLNSEERRRVTADGVELDLSTPIRFDAVNSLLSSHGVKIDFDERSTSGAPIGIANEPTEILAKLDLHQVRIILQTQLSPVAISEPFQIGDDIHKAQALTADGLAQLAYSRENPDAFPWLDVYPSVDLPRYWAASSGSYRFTIQLGSNVSVSRRVDGVASLSGIPCSFGELPQQFLDSVKTAITNIRVTHSNVRGAGSMPPPSF